MVIIKASKGVSKVKKGDKVKVDGLELEVDAHYVLIDHGNNTKEMTIELFDNDDKEYQLRYFSDRAEESMEFFELQDIMYTRKDIKKVEF